MTHTNGSITNNTSNKLFYFRGSTRVKDSRQQGVQSIPFINTDPGNTILFRFQGKTERFGLTCAIFDDGTDVAGGTHSSDVKTVQEQIDYLKDHIDTSDFEDSWNLYEKEYFDPAVEVVIEKMDIEDVSPELKLVTFEFVRGKVGGF